MTIFGQILTAADVEQATLMTIKEWLPTYCREIERQEGFDVNSLLPIRSYQVFRSFDHWDENGLPGIVVVSPGTEGTPQKQGDGQYSVWWSLGVIVLVSAMDAKSSNDTAKSFSAAIRALMLQKAKLQGLINDIVWAGESFVDSADDKSRTLVAAAVQFRVETYNTVSRYGGPASPDPDPADWPEVETVGITITKEES